MGSVAFGAEQVVRKCLKVKPNEMVVLIVDGTTRSIADALCAILRETTDSVIRFNMDEFGDRPDDGSRPLQFPGIVGQALRSATVSIYAASSKRGELKSFRNPMLDRVESNPALRHAHMLDVTQEVMETGMSGDYDAIQALSTRVYDIVKSAHSIRVTSPIGTDFTARFNREWKWVLAGGQIAPGQWSNLPEGEVFTCPETVDGIAVIDGCVGDHFAALGTCETFPVVVGMRDGLVTQLRCEARPALEKELNEYIRQDENASRVGEFAMGTNIGVDRIIGNVLQDEKFPGVHIAIGDGITEQTGSPWRSDAHVDLVLRNVTVLVDDKPIMRDGKFLI
jgi:aminopeptidase